MTTDPVRLKDFKDRKGHLCVGGHFDTKLGPICGCGAVLEGQPDFMDLTPEQQRGVGHAPGSRRARVLQDEEHAALTSQDKPQSAPPVSDPPLLAGDGNPPAPFRHANGEPCYGCQSCFANMVDDDDLPADAGTPMALLAEADEAERPGRELIAQHGGPDMTPSVPPIDPTMPYGPAEVERGILDAVQRLERGVAHEANLIAAAEQLKIEYELAFARAVRDSQGGAADQRKADAVLRCEPEYRAWADACAVRDAMKAITHTLRSTLSGLQSVGRSVGVSYQTTPGRGR